MENWYYIVLRSSWKLYCYDAVRFGIEEPWSGFVSFGRFSHFIGFVVFFALSIPLFVQNRHKCNGSNSPSLQSIPLFATLPSSRCRWVDWRINLRSNSKSIVLNQILSNDSKFTAIHLNMDLKPSTFQCWCFWFRSDNFFFAFFSCLHFSCDKNIYDSDYNRRI